MNFLVWGNIIMLIASVVMVLSGFCRSRKSTIIMQTAQMGIMAFGALCLGGFAGATMNCFSAVRNVLSYKGKLNTSAKIVLIAVSTTIALTVNNIGIVGLIPIVVFVMYALCMNVEDVIWHKILAIVGCSLFFIHDLYIHSYTSCVFNAVTVVTNTYVVITILLARQKSSIETAKAAI